MAAAIAQVFAFSSYGQMLGIHDGAAQFISANAADALTSSLYSGETYDVNIQQQYLRARFYDPATGRFNRLDPFSGNMNDPQSLHKYAYVHGDPIQGVDPTGLFSLAGISLGGLITSSLRGASLGAVGGFFIGYADARLGGASREDALRNGATLAIYGAVFGAISGPIWLIALKGYGILQAFAIAAATIEVSAAAGFGAAAVGESIKNENYAQAGFRAVVAAFLVRQGARGLGGVRPRTRPIGDFSNLRGSLIGEALDAVPPNAQVRKLTPVPGKVQDGVEFKWVEAGKTWRVRIHGPDPSAPAGSNARDGWIIRIQRGQKYMDDSGVFHPPGVSNPASSNYSPTAANATHIPIQTPTVNGR